MAASISEALLVKFCSTTTRLSKSMTSARSCGRSRLANPIAAAWAVLSFTSMLALVSSNSDNAIGRFDLLKKVTSCFTPSSKTLKSSCVRSVTYLPPPSVTMTFNDTNSTPARNDGCCPVAPRAPWGVWGRWRWLLLLRRNSAWCGRAECERYGQRGRGGDAFHGCPSFTGVPRATRPFFTAATVIFSGGISDSGRP